MTDVIGATQAASTFEPGRSNDLTTVQGHALNFAVCPLFAKEINVKCINRNVRQASYK